MLIHLVPRLYNWASDVHAELLDVAVPEIGLSLIGGKDIVARRPYPNKCFLVACRKVGQRAINGLLVEAPAHLATYTSVTRWAVNAEIVVTHEVQHVVVDADFEAVTGEMVLWYAYRTFANRWSAGLYPDFAPVHVQPRMDIVDPALSECGPRVGANSKDEVAGDGIVLRRRERFLLPTIEPERLSAWTGDAARRMPSPADVFRA
ncbi:MAG: hypothetical protein E6Q67_01705 [Roseateles sp.]|nr:MAG: hypothetical protein E6Q67_01705 [Roseateles sp.]